MSKIAARRHKAAKYRAKCLRRAKATFGSYFAENQTAVARLAAHHTFCSGPCCGNPRKWFRKKTRQELKAEEVRK